MPDTLFILTIDVQVSGQCISQMGYLLHVDKNGFWLYNVSVTAVFNAA
jgi:hypothetical protein